jgi:aryl-alcohol dehydrogenase-like predicted oxidoreductase
MHWGETPLDRVIAGRVLPDEVVEAIRDRSRLAGVTLIDTAEGYGGGSSERRIGRLRFADGHLLATKFLPTYWRWTPGAVVRSQRASNRRLGVETCDVGFIHSPIHFRSPEVWVKGFARARRRGLVRALGLSNFSADQVWSAVRIAAAEGIPVVANQIQYSLLVAASPALQETVAASRECGLTVLGYGVLGQGLLTDGLTQERFEGNLVARRLGLSWDLLTPVRTVLSEVAAKRGRPMSHIGLAWARAHGVVPLVGTRSVAQLEDSLGALDLSLAPDEVEALDGCALGLSTFERPRWQRLLALALVSALMLGYKASAAASLRQRKLHTDKL